MPRGATRVFLIKACALILILALPNLALARASGEPSMEEKARLKLAEAFEAVAEAERLGGNVSELVDELNRALGLIEEAKGDSALLQEALSMVEGVASKAPEVGRAGAAAAQFRTIQSLLAFGAIIALCAVAWRYGPRAFWRLWVWAKKGWKVKP